MEVLALALGTLVLYLVVYHTYGKALGRRLFRLDGGRRTPAHELADGRDYVPTSRGVVFGHHFTSIAGTGPIVGPAIAVIWGWLPALLWILFGSILLGAVHDLATLVVSLRQRGRTVGDIAAEVISPRARLLFLWVLFFSLTIVLAVFGIVVAVVFRTFPVAIAPCLLQTPLALGIGFWLHRRGARLLWPSVIALGLMVLSIICGDWGPLHALNSALAGLPIMTWVAIMLVYAGIASVLPVWVLLQPRDYINSLQLVGSIGAVLLGLVVAGLIGGPSLADGSRHALEFAAPAWRGDVPGAPAMIPFLFITIACGAISGFHCLVSSGTSSKQLESEDDAIFVGFGSMLIEGFLAVLVVLACVAGIGLGASSTEGGILFGAEAWQARYASWAGMSGLPAKIGAFVEGAANFLRSLGLPAGFSTALMGVFVASFAITTMDSACRLQRYVIQELAAAGRSPASVASDTGTDKLSPVAAGFAWLTRPVPATLVAVLAAAGLAWVPSAPGAGPGTGGMVLWPLFGATNQLLGGLAFLVVLFWLRRRGAAWWIAAGPAAFMLAVPTWASLHQLFVQAPGSERSWLSAALDGGPWQSWLVVGLCLVTLVLQLWILLECLRHWQRQAPGAEGILLADSSS